MSAHVVTMEHIDVLVQAAYTVACSDNSKMSWWRTNEDGRFAGWRSLFPSTMGSEPVIDEHELGQMLIDTNIESVRYRYPDDECPDRPYVAHPIGFMPTPGEVFQTIDSYCYQACEHPGWYGSEANAFCRFLRKLWCERVPGYAEAPWEWDLGRLSNRRPQKWELRLGPGFAPLKIR